MENNMPKPFTYWLPNWIQNDLKNRSCSQCETKVFKQDIVAVGIRQTGKPHECAMYIEYICSSCEYRALITFGKEKEKENSIEKMCCNILESIKRKKLTEKSLLLRRRKEGVITDREVKKFLSFNKNASHEEFLKEIGMSFPQNKDDTS